MHDKKSDQCQVTSDQLVGRDSVEPAHDSAPTKSDASRRSLGEGGPPMFPKASAQPLSPEAREQGGKLLAEILEEALDTGPFTPWGALDEKTREIDSVIYEKITAALRLKIQRQAAEQKHLLDLYFKAFDLAGGKSTDDLDSLPILISRVRTLLVRARCRCIQKDCLKHGAWIPEEVELWERLVYENFPSPKELSCHPVEDSPPRERSAGPSRSEQSTSGKQSRPPSATGA